MGALGTLGSLAGSLGTLESSLGSSANSGTPKTSDSSGPSWLQTETATIVTILLGMILIIAGLFQFKTVQTVTGYAGKAALSV
jgi:type II secretory pathway component GspD/PulD (secretin)